MSPTTLRLIGIMFMVMAAIAAVLNLRRVANLGAFYLPGLFIIIGGAFMAASRRRRM